MILIIIALDEGERILIVTFLRESISRVLWTSLKGDDCDAMRFRALGTILDWRIRGQAGWLAIWHK